MSELLEYARSLSRNSGEALVHGELFAKVLTRNDDSGRHGVLVPSDSYSFFPNLEILDPASNKTDTFQAFDSISNSWTTLAYKYYERYPERRITRLNGLLNNVAAAHRLLVVLKLKHQDGVIKYYIDCLDSSICGRFDTVFKLIFGGQIAPDPGAFIVRPIDAPAFSADYALNELLARFDKIKSMGWINALRSGDTGIGYTFETLVGIKENNDKTADFNGIEIKCKGMKEGQYLGSSKINLFQAGPTWSSETDAKDRIRVLGRLGNDGLYACYSQVTTTPNNLGLLLKIVDTSSKIDLLKNTSDIGYWSFKQLESRLLEKHSRTAFVKAKTRRSAASTQFSYEELVYCDKPSIERFIHLVSDRNIVFEFTLSERPNGEIRNHGYPWRLIRSEFLDHLFSFQIKLR